MGILIAIALIVIGVLGNIWLSSRARRKDPREEAEEKMEAFGLYEGPSAPDELTIQRRGAQGRGQAEQNQALRSARREEERRWTE